MSMKNLSNPFIRCRTLGHTWRVVYTNSNQICLNCSSCHTRRLDSVAVGSGRVTKRQYTYPPGYSLAGQDRPTRNAFRVEFINRNRRK